MILYCLSFILLYKLTTSCSHLYSARTRLNLSAVASDWRIILKMYFSIYHQNIIFNISWQLQVLEELFSKIVLHYENTQLLV